MTKFFDINNPLWKLMAFLSDMMILSILWVIFSLPVVTVGASTAALYEVCVKKLDYRGRGVIREFTTMYIQSMRKMLLPGMFMVVFFSAAFFNIYLFHNTSGQLGTFLLFVNLFLLLLVFTELIYIFPLLVQLKIRLITSVKLAILLTFQNAVWTFLLVITNVSVIFISAYVAPYLSLVSFTTLALLNTRVVGHLYENSLIDLEEII